MPGLVFLEAAFLVQVHPQAERYEPAGPGDAGQFVEGVGRGVAGSEHAHADYRVERVGIVPQLLPQSHLAEVAVKALPPRLFQHPQGKVHGVEVVVAQGRQALGHQPRAGPRVQDFRPRRHVLHEQVRRRPGRVPLEVLGQVLIVLGGPLVIAFLQLPVGSGRVYPLDPVLTLLHLTSRQTKRPQPSSPLSTAAAVSM